MKEKAKTSLTPLSRLVSLRNKRALITGSGTGIGEAIANRFAEAGADLELVDVNEERLNKYTSKAVETGIATSQSACLRVI
jgi:NAD(P)-dependent dehydrogenase (short-subunit alcohol dehydrogenase family)